MKQTEIGLIPDNWEVKMLGDVTRIQAGGTPSTLFEAYWNGNIRWMNSGELKLKRVYEVEGRITELGLNNSSTHLIPKGCVLIGLAGQGKTRGTAAINYVDLCTNQSIAAIFPSDFHNSDFLYHVMDNKYQELRELSDGGGGRGGLNLKILNDIQIPLPPLPEQQRIAKALSDVDALISTTEKLLQKKRNIKQGTMQELLTGKKRLPGFGPQTKSQTYKQTELGHIPEDWDVKNIKELGVFISGSGFPLIEQGRKNEKYPFFKVSDFNNLGNENKLISANNYVSETVASKLCCKIVKKNSIVFAKIGAAIMLERKRITAYDCCIDNNMMAFTVNSDNDFSYLCYNFQQIPFASLSSSTALPSLSSKIIGNQLISVPSKEEQTAIANVLSSMDKEIETLNTKLEKYRNLKTAMMQQLLTGKIRLV